MAGVGAFSKTYNKFATAWESFIVVPFSLLWHIVSRPAVDMSVFGASYTIPDCYRSGVTFISDRGISYNPVHNALLSGVKIILLWW